MKLRNKKTGEIKAVNHAKILVHYSDGTTDAFHSIKQLTDKYSDYTEPLIKDEKIRKAVRAWADANEFEPKYEVKYYSNAFMLTSWQADIEFNSSIKDLEDEKVYTIAELCGEEEE